MVCVHVVQCSVCLRGAVWCVFMWCSVKIASMGSTWLLALTGSVEQGGAFSGGAFSGQQTAGCEWSNGGACCR